MKKLLLTSIIIVLGICFKLFLCNPKAYSLSGACDLIKNSRTIQKNHKMTDQEYVLYNSVMGICDNDFEGSFYKILPKYKFDKILEDKSLKQAIIVTLFKYPKKLFPHGCDFGSIDTSLVNVDQQIFANQNDQGLPTGNIYPEWNLIGRISNHEDNISAEIKIILELEKTTHSLVEKFVFKDGKWKFQKINIFPSG